MIFVAHLLLGKSTAVPKPMISSGLGSVTAVTSKIVDVSVGKMPSPTPEQVELLAGHLATIQSFYNNALGTLIGLLALAFVFSTGLVVWIETIARRRFDRKFLEISAEIRREAEEAKKFAAAEAAVLKTQNRENRKANLQANSELASFAALVFNRESKRFKSEDLTNYEERIDYLERTPAPVEAEENERARELRYTYRRLKREIELFEETLSIKATAMVFLVISIAKSLDAEQYEESKSAIRNFINDLRGLSRKSLELLESKMEDATPVTNVLELGDDLLKRVGGTDYEPWYRRAVSDLQAARQNALETSYDDLYRYMEHLKSRVATFENGKS